MIERGPFVPGTTFYAFLAVLAFVGAARIAELIVARRWTKAAAARGEVPQREPAFVAMVLLHVLPFVLAPAEVIFLDTPFSWETFWSSTASLAVLFVLRVWTLGTLGKNWNVRVVRPAQVIASGPYAFVRHPNYAIVIAELFFLPLVHAAWRTCLVVSVLNALVLWRRIPREEKLLMSLPGYAEAMAHKPRFIPFSRPRSAAGSSPPPA